MSAGDQSQQAAMLHGYNPSRPPLYLSKNHAQLFRAWSAGFDAQTAGIEESKCPYTDRRKEAWHKGWSASQRVSEMIARLNPPSSTEPIPTFCPVLDRTP